MEYHRFLTWAREAGVLSALAEVSTETRGNDHAWKSCHLSLRMAAFKLKFKVQIETAIGQILDIMNSVESIVSKYQTKEINLPAPPSNRVASGLGSVLPLVGTRPNLDQAEATAKRQQSAQLLLKDGIYPTTYPIRISPLGRKR
jgi:hypothetical protein